MKQARILTKSELKRVLELQKISRNGLRNRLSILLSHYAGLRVGEIALLDWNDILDINDRCKDIIYLTADQTKSSEARQICAQHQMDECATAVRLDHFISLNSFAKACLQLN